MMVAEQHAAHKTSRQVEDSEDSEVAERKVRGLDEAEEDHTDVNMRIVAPGVEKEAEEEKHMYREVWEVVEDLEEEHRMKVEDKVESSPGASSQGHNQTSECHKEGNEEDRKEVGLLDKVQAEGHNLKAGHIELHPVLTLVVVVHAQAQVCIW
jgi:hypothetical protein